MIRNDYTSINTLIHVHVMRIDSGSIEILSTRTQKKILTHTDSEGVVNEKGTALL